MGYKMWACDPLALESYLNDIEVQNSLAISAGAIDDIIKYTDSQDKLELDANGMATIKIDGVLTMDGPSQIAKFFGVKGASYSNILDQLDSALSNDMVKAITLAINSPGGEVQGVDSVWSKVMEVKKTKPVGALNTGMVASAAYYIASAADKIYGISPTVETGSIGAVISGIDDTKAMEKAGYKRVSVYSKNAPNKGMDIATDAGVKLLQERVDAFEAIFHERVAEGRGVTAKYVGENFGKGGVFIASHPDKTKPDAITMGLLDGISEKYIVQNGANLIAANIQENPQEGERMKLKEFLAQNPEAAAEIEQIKAATISEFSQRAERVNAILSSDVYSSNSVIRKKGIECIAGKISVDSFEGMVAMADMMEEQKKLSVEMASQIKETQAQVGEVSDGAEVVAKSMGIDVEQLKAYAAANKIPADKAIQAAIDNQKMIESDRGVK